MGEKQRVLVTGGAGYIGSHTCKALFNAGYEPLVYDNLVYGHEWAVKWGPLEQGDLLEKERLMDVIRRYDVHGVIHFAAYAYVGESVKNPSKYYTNNISGTLSLLNAMKETGLANIVFSSTCATYGIPMMIPITEDHPQNPINPYGFTKLVIERALQDYAAAYGLRYGILRYFNAAGADPDGETGEDHSPETHLIPLAIRATIDDEFTLQVYGHDYDTKDGTAIRDYVHVMDLADAHVSGLKYLAEGNGSFRLNLGTGVGYSVREIVDSVEHVTGIKVRFKYADRREGDPPVLVANNSAAKTVLSWAPRYTAIDEIIRSAVNWHNKHGNFRAR